MYAQRWLWMTTWAIGIAGSLTSFANAQFSFCDPDTPNIDGAIERICMPAEGLWNGDLVVYAHGYVESSQPVGIPENQLVLNGVSIPEVVNFLGYGFATTSYRSNGLAIKYGSEDLGRLIQHFIADQGLPNHIYLVGVSEGGLIVTRTIEQNPNLFSGALALCGPIGDFQAQVNWVGDFRVLFDYFFPDVLPGSADEIPQELMDEWETHYAPQVVAAIWSDIPALIQLLNTSRAPIDVFNESNLLASIQNTVLTLLWYNVFGTNDATVKLGGNPYHNLDTYYVGSSNDFLLNLGVARFGASPEAIQEIAQYYQTTGLLEDPVVTLHTVLDEIVPFFHAELYWIKAVLNARAHLNIPIPILRYGHCNFTIEEVLFSFVILVVNAEGEAPPPLQDRIDDLGTWLDVKKPWPVGEGMSGSEIEKAPLLSKTKLKRLLKTIRQMPQAKIKKPFFDTDQPTLSRSGH